METEQLLILLIAAVAAIVGIGRVIDVMRQSYMMRDLAKRLPQTPEEWQAERDREWKALDRLLEDDSDDLS